jgi:hypothetical protein
MMSGTNCPETVLYCEPKKSESCLVCARRVRDNQRAIFCDICCRWVHLSCTNLNIADYVYLSDDDVDLYCTKCTNELFPFNHIDDDEEFINTLHSFCREFPSFNGFVPSKQQFSILNNMDIINNNDIDPDKNIYNTMDIASKYYLPSELNDTIADTLIDGKLSVLHIKAHSLKDKTDQLEVLLNSLKLAFDIIAVSETWDTNVTVSLTNIAGYTKEYKIREDGRKGGGVALFIKNNILYKKWK